VTKEPGTTGGGGLREGEPRGTAALFRRRPPLVGMVHLLPLPGAPGWGGSMDAVIARAVGEARLLASGGVDGVLVENYRDIPFLPGPVPPETVAAMAVAVGAVQAAVQLPVGVNVLRNDASAALGVAVATGAFFIRVNVHSGTMISDQGSLTGAAFDTLRRRQALGAQVAILADVFVKHAVPPPGLTLEAAARDSWERGLADGLILSGTSTGAPTDPQRLQRVRAILPEAELWVGSGLTPENAATLLPLCDGAIVGSAIHREGRAGAGLDPRRIRTMVEAAEPFRRDETG